MNRYPSRIIVGFPKLINGRDEENAAIQAIAGEHLEERRMSLQCCYKRVP